MLPLDPLISAVVPLAKEAIGSLAGSSGTGSLLGAVTGDSSRDESDKRFIAFLASFLDANAMAVVVGRYRDNRAMLDDPKYQAFFGFSGGASDDSDKRLLGFLASFLDDRASAIVIGRYRNNRQLLDGEKYAQFFGFTQ